jgi:uncharacterized protein (TIGR02145 family)
MAENLRTTRYQSGDPITTDLSVAEWDTATSGAFAIYPYDYVIDGINSEEEMIVTYGRHYNWYAVGDSRGLCPVGWHVPSDDEWKQIEIYLGMSPEDADEHLNRGTDEGGKLKSIRTQPETHPRWRSPNIGATNESGFSGLPGGFRGNNGYFYAIGDFGGWWSSTEYVWDSNIVWYRYLSFADSKVAKHYDNKQGGYTIRCLLD